MTRSVVYTNYDDGRMDPSKCLEFQTMLFLQCHVQMNIAELCRILPELKKTQVFHRIVQIGLYFTNERHFEGKLGFLELLSIKFESFSQ